MVRQDRLLVTFFYINRNGAVCGRSFKKKISYACLANHRLQHLPHTTQATPSIKPLPHCHSTHQAFTIHATSINRVQSVLSVINKLLLARMRTGNMLFLALAFLAVVSTPGMSPLSIFNFSLHTISKIDSPDALTLLC
jgi:hypothetical protein